MASLAMRIFPGVLTGALLASVGLNMVLYLHTSQPGLLHAAADRFGESPRATSRDHFRGATAGEVAIFEYVNFQCPHSRDQDAQLRRLVAAHPEVTWVRRHLPHETYRESERSAQASECAADQGAFWEYSDLLFENQAELADLDTLLRLAESGPLDTELFRECMRTESGRDRVRADSFAAASRGIRVTPTLYIGGTRYDGFMTYEGLERVLRRREAGTTGSGGTKDES